MVWLAAYALVAVIVFEGRPGSLPYVIVAVLAAWLVVRRLPPVRSGRVAVAGVVRFIPYFALRSLAGGVDVALRAVHGPRALRPGFIRFRTRIRTPDARVLLANSISLLPGTLTARLEDDVLLVHTLDTNAPVRAQLQALEDRIAGIFVGER